MIKSALTIVVLVCLSILMPVVRSDAETQTSAEARSRSHGHLNVTGRYASVNGLKMYYEIHGSGRPLVLLHGGLGTIDTSFDKLLPILARTRQVIAIELQGHGHTADTDRPMRFEQLADDVAALLAHLGIAQADVLGYSFGGIVALGTAVRHPTVVGRVILLGTPNGFDGFEPEIREAIKKATPQDTPAPLRAAYERVAPDPGRFPIVVGKVGKLLQDFRGWRSEDLRSLRMPVLLIVGDHDFIRPEHAVETFRLLPTAQLTFVPGAGHDSIQAHHEEVLAAIARFLYAPRHRLAD